MWTSLGPVKRCPYNNYYLQIFGNDKLSCTTQDLYNSLQYSKHDTNIFNVIASYKPYIAISH